MLPIRPLKGPHQIWYNLCNEPVAAAVDQRGVLYVCDKGDGAIYRFKLSNTLNDEIILED